MWAQINQTIRRAFSEAACRYDVFSDLHREIGRELVKKHLVPAVDTACHILDVGTGTGYVAHKAKFFFPDARVVGLDFAPGMLRMAKAKNEGVLFVQADACALPFADGCMDAVVSNLAYQWAGDTRQAFSQVERVLVPDGVFVFTCFGFHTLDELFIALDNTQKMSRAIVFKRLPDCQTIKESLESVGLRDVDAQYERIKVEFADLWELLRWLKGIGANVLPHAGYVGRDMLKQAADYCRKHYSYHGGIGITFEVIWAKGIK